MATQKPISTISYNSESFLKEKLDTWVNAHIIQAYQYICHKGEDGDKDHIHVRLEPNKKLDPMVLQDELREWVRDNDKPLGCRPFRPSKEEDWYLYVVHDPDYLKLKYNGGEKGEKIPYSWKNIKANEYYDTEIAFIRAKAYMEHTSVNMATRMQNGENPMSLILQGENVYTVNALMRALSTTDYQRLSKQYSELEHEYNMLLNAIESIGYTPVLNDQGVIVLEKVAPSDHKAEGFMKIPENANNPFLDNM